MAVSLFWKLGLGAAVSIAFRIPTSTLVGKKGGSLASGNEPDTSSLKPTKKWSEGSAWSSLKLTPQSKSMHDEDWQERPTRIHADQEESTFEEHVEKVETFVDIHGYEPQKLPDMDGKPQFFNGYCPLPENLGQKFKSFQMGETYPKGIRCDGWVHFENEQAVANLREVYNKEIRANPVFIDELIRLRKKVTGFDSNGQHLQLKSYLNAPRLYNLWKLPQDAPPDDYRVGVYFAPNLGYNMLKQLAWDSEQWHRQVRDHKGLKQIPGGITYIGWFLHPLTLSGDNRKRSDECRENISNTYDINNWDDTDTVRKFTQRSEAAQLRYGDRLVNGDSVHFQQTKAREGPKMSRHECKMTGQEMLEETGKKYYSTIMDFEKEDLDILKWVRQAAIDKLEQFHGLALPKDCPSGKTKVEGSDAILLYFHFPYALNTVTVHLHVRINQGIHPFEAQYSVFLDDIISWLEEHDNIYGLIMKRATHGQQHTATSPFAKGFGCIGKHLGELFENEPWKWNERELGVKFLERWDPAQANSSGVVMTDVVREYCPDITQCGRQCMDLEHLMFSNVSEKTKQLLDELGGHHYEHRM